MTYKIRQSKENEFGLEFKFKNQSAKVSVKVLNPRRLYVNSHTDGYHWSQFWMAQEPDAQKLLELSYEKEKNKVVQSLSAHGFKYIDEDRETFFLETETDVTRETIDTLAKYLHPRFALRENFFHED